jgi:hypothetical protein
MIRLPKHPFWREFWPKALIIVGIVAALWLLEYYGLIQRW